MEKNNRRGGEARGSRGCRFGQRGFSLHDLLVALGLAGGLSVAGTGLHDMVQRHRVTVEVNQFVTHLALARSEAIKRGDTVTFCPSADGQRCAKPADFTWWHSGTLLFSDTNGNDQVDGSESVVRVHVPSERVEIKSSRGRARVLYQPSGTSGGSPITFTVCARGAEARYVIVSNSGRARVSSQPPDGRVDEPLEQCS